VTTQQSTISGTNEPTLTQTSQSVEVLVLLFKPHLVRLQNFLWSLKNQQCIDLRVVLVYDGIPAEGESSQLHNLASQFDFALCFFQHQIGTYRHAERAMNLLLSGNNPFVIADQDDWWMPDRLDKQLRLLKLNNVSAVVSNANICYKSTKTRTLLFDVLRTEPESLRYQMICNHVTGAGTLFSEHIVQRVLPFPTETALSFHDHWLGIVAHASNGVFIDPSPRWHYIQHETNQVGMPASHFHRMLSLLKKIWNVALYKSASSREYLQTIEHFRDALVSRVPHSIPVDSYLMYSDSTRARRRVFKFMNLLEALVYSRLEILRFALLRNISRQKR